MGTRAEVKSAASISDAAVRTATGKGWKEWFSILDKAGARKMEHQAIARLLHDEQGVGDWWRQMVTVEYERVRGPRENYQSPEGFRVSIGKTIAVPIENLFDAWADTGKRKATPSKSMRVTWPDGTSLEVNFWLVRRICG